MDIMDIHFPELEGTSIESTACFGPFEDYQFKNKLTWIPDNTPNMIDSFISVNELCLAKSNVSAPLRQNLTTVKMRN